MALSKVDREISDLLREAERTGQKEWINDAFDVPIDLEEDDEDLLPSKIPLEPMLTPHQAKERMRNRIKMSDWDDIADNWIKQAKNNKSPSWATFFATTFLPQEQAAANPLETVIAKIIENASTSAVGYQVAIEDELNGYIDVEPAELTATSDTEAPKDDI